MIALSKPKFWDKKLSIISVMLLPFSLLFFLLVFFRKKFTKVKIFKIPIICVGNIYIGGTGKTPISILLANEIAKLGKKTAILRKFYKNHKDEHSLIKKNFKNLILTQSRVDELKKIEKSNFDLVILDDGFQDYEIRKDISILCFNQNQLIGNGLILPAGPLRETLSALKDADIVIINGNKNKYFEEKILNINNKIEIFYSSYQPINLQEFKLKRLFAVAGIGNPENFFQLLEKNNLDVVKKLIFPDHYKFSKEEVENILKLAEKENSQVIMTEKDYFKIKDFKLKKLQYLKVSLKINNQDKLIKKIGNLYDKNN